MKSAKTKGPERLWVNDRDAIKGIWHVLWSGCQWKSIEQNWFHVSSSTLHDRFQTWTKAGIFDKLFNGAENLVVIRHIAINLLCIEITAKVPYALPQRNVFLLPVVLFAPGGGAALAAGAQPQGWVLSA